MRSNRTLMLTVLLCGLIWLIGTTILSGTGSESAGLASQSMRGGRRASVNYDQQQAGAYVAGGGLATMERDGSPWVGGDVSQSPEGPELETRSSSDVPYGGENDYRNRPSSRPMPVSPPSIPSPKNDPSSGDEAERSAGGTSRPSESPGADDHNETEDTGDYGSSSGDSGRADPGGAWPPADKDAEDNGRASGRVDGKGEKALDEAGYKRRAAQKEGDATVAVLDDELEGQGHRDDTGRSTEERRGARLQARPRAERPRPLSFLPRWAYFENTYLGGNASVLERQRRLDASWGGATPCPYRLANLGPQAFDAPATDGLGLHCSLDRSWQEKPGRVMLQIGLRGSDRYGWRRPPLDVMCVVDMSALAVGRAQVQEAIVSLVRQLGPQDKLGLAFASNAGGVYAPPRRLRDVRAELPGHMTKLTLEATDGASGLRDAMAYAGRVLSNASGSGVPGTQTVLVIAGPADANRIDSGRAMAHDLSLMGIVTSVVELGAAHNSAWWDVAHHGQGNHHRVAGAALDAVVASEIGSLARVVARLARVNIRLSADAHAVRILGSRILTQKEVRRVKDREESTDRQLSRSLGVKSDRGEDDDGLQTVIPYFYGGDAHVILIELWVDRPGTVAEISVRYKDMVRLTNAQVHATVRLAHAPRQSTGLEEEVMRNAARFRIAEQLGLAVDALHGGNAAHAISILQGAANDVPAGSSDRRMIDELMQRARAEGRSPRVLDAIDLASSRMVGHSLSKTGR